MLSRMYALSEDNVIEIPETAGILPFKVNEPTAANGILTIFQTKGKCPSKPSPKLPAQAVPK